MPIGNTLYHKHNAKWFQGKKVRTTTELRNGRIVIPKGAHLTIQGKSSGFLLHGMPCDHCGVKVIISKVAPWTVEFVEREDEKPTGQNS